MRRSGVRLPKAAPLSLQGSGLFRLGDDRLPVARWHGSWHDVIPWAYRHPMARGSVETLRSGYRARVYAGLDPITGQQIYMRGETRRHRRDAEADAERLVSHVEADRRPDQHATVG